VRLPDDPEQRQPKQQAVNDEWHQADPLEQGEKGGYANPAGGRREGHGQDKLNPVNVCISSDDPQGAVTTRSTDYRYRQEKGKAGCGIRRKTEKPPGRDRYARSLCTRNQSKSLGQTNQQGAAQIYLIQP